MKYSTPRCRRVSRSCSRERIKWNMKKSTLQEQPHPSSTCRNAVKQYKLPRGKENKKHKKTPTFAFLVHSVCSPLPYHTVTTLCWAGSQSFFPLRFSRSPFVCPWSLVRGGILKKKNDREPSVGECTRMGSPPAPYVLMSRNKAPFSKWGCCGWTAAWCWAAVRKRKKYSLPFHKQHEAENKAVSLQD